MGEEALDAGECLVVRVGTEEDEDCPCGWVDEDVRQRLVPFPVQILLLHNAPAPDRETRAGPDQTKSHKQHNSAPPQEPGASRPTFKLYRANEFAGSASMRSSPRSGRAREDRK